LWTAAPQEVTFLIFARLIQAVIPGISIWINKQVVDTVAITINSSGNYNFWTPIILVAGWVAAILLQNLLSPWEQAAKNNARAKITARIELLLIKKANNFKDLIRFEDSQFYDELQLIQQEVAYRPITLLGTIVEVFQSSITLITMLFLLAPVGWWIPLLILLSSLPQTYFSFKIQSDMWALISRKSPQSRRMKYYSSVMLTDTYAKEVRLFGLGDLFTDRYIDAFEDKEKAMRKLRGKQAFFQSFLSIISASGNGFGFYWVVSKAFSGVLSPGNVLLFIQSLTYTQQSINSLMARVFLLQETLISMERLFRFLDSKITLSLSVGGRSVPSPIASGITFDRVSFTYPDGRVALEDISFKIEPGETIALVGENGAGKTTLIKLLSRFYDPTRGKILIDNIPLKNLDLEAWRKQIAVVFQDFSRYSLTIGENIALGNLLEKDNLKKIEIAAKKSGIADRITKLEYEYETPLGKQFDGTELSGGEWQKVAIARAFMRQETAQILVLDEPTAALDPRSEYEIYNRFSELVKGKMSVLVTHRLASVRMSDRIIVLKSGRLIETGTHKELLQLGGEYANLWSMQATRYQS
ncbi:MAG: ABC transporter ATP-binding protein, partial [Prochloraceae cyanobacterium]|nr:ABC transporter ATP-binding protein [Prochloraceae cyanobacterium]